jgi:hypothetical protein
MTDLLTERPLDWATAHGAERIVAVGVLGVRPLRYMGEGVAPAGPVVEGLRVQAVGSGEVPGFHRSSGVYGFLHLEPGTWRVQITDPSGRFMPWAISAAAPDRSLIRTALEQNGIPPSGPPALLIDVAMRPVPGVANPPGLTAIWGVVRQGAGGPPVPLARIACDTVAGGSVVAWSQLDGSYLLVLPLEKPTPLATPPKYVFPRALKLHAPKPALAASLAAAGLLASLPANLDTLDPNAAGSPFQSRHYRLRDATGALLAGTDPNLPVRAAQQARWDIELTP